MSQPTLDEILFKLRTTREVELNDNRWTKDFVYPLDEAKQQLTQLIAQERKAGRLEGLEMAKQSVICKEDERHVEVLLHTQRAKEHGIDL